MRIGSASQDCSGQKGDGLGRIWRIVAHSSRPHITRPMRCRRRRRSCPGICVPPIVVIYQLLMVAEVAELVVDGVCVYIVDIIIVMDGQICGRAQCG